MMVSALLCFIYCNRMIAPTIEYPPSAYTGVVRTASVPGSVAYSNAVKRLDSHAQAAMYGTFDAMVQRRIFPMLVNYGGARGKSVQDLVSADFQTSRFAEDNTIGGKCWHSTFFWALHESAGNTYLVSATNRFFAEDGARIWRPKSLLDNRVLGDGEGATRFSYMKFTDADAYNYRIRWLNPDVDHESLPDGEWHLDNEAATADWNRYLLELGELPSTNIAVYGSSTNAFRPFKIDEVSYPSQIGISADTYMETGGFETPESVIGEDSFDGLLMGRGTKRGRLYGPLSSLLAAKGAGVNVFSISNGPNNRIDYDRFAIANSCLACQAVSMFSSPNGYGNPTYYHSETNDFFDADSRSPKYTFIKKDLDAYVYSRLVVTNAPGAVFSINADRDKGYNYLSFDRNKWGSSSYLCTNSCSVVTSSMDWVESAWEDKECAGRVGLLASRVIRLSDFSMSYAGLNPGRYKISVEFYVYPDYSYSPRMKGFNSPLYYDIGSFVGAMTNWTAEIEATYSMNARGIFSDGTFYEMIGPTVLDGDIEKYESGEPYSVKAYKLHPMFEEADIVSKFSLHSRDVCGITTNNTVISKMSSGEGNFSFGTPKDEWGYDPETHEYIIIHPKDTWAFFRYASPSTAFSGRQLDAGFSNLYSVYDSDINECANMVPRGSYEIPDIERAKSVSAQKASEFMEDDINNNRMIVSRGTGSKGGFQTDYYFVKDDSLAWHFEDTSGNVVDDAIIGTWTISADIGTTNPRRKSLAVYYERLPFVLTYWNFPMMRYYEYE